MNEALADEGQDSAVFVEHRSFKDRGGTQRAQKHMGPKRTNAIRRQQRQARQAWLAARSRSLTERHASERAALAAHQERAREQKLRDLADRERQAIKTAREVVEAEPSVAKPGMLQRLAGLFGREAAAPPPPAPERQAEARIEAVRASMHGERDAYTASQAKERQALDSRHAAEGRQLDTAAMHRVFQDRLAEQDLRRDPGHERVGQERVVGRDTGRSLR